MLTLLGRQEMKKRQLKGFATQIDRFVFALFSLWATSDLGLTHSCSVIFISIQFELLEDLWWKYTVIKWNFEIVTNNYPSFIKYTLFKKKVFPMWKLTNNMYVDHYSNKIISMYAQLIFDGKTTSAFERKNLNNHSVSYNVVHLSVIVNLIPLSCRKKANGKYYQFYFYGFYRVAKRMKTPAANK